MKNKEIQALRAFFCLIIIIFHFTSRYKSIFNTDIGIFNNFIFDILGTFGVLSFFLISGIFLIPLKYNTKKDKLLCILKRFLSIWLTYICAIVVIYILSLTSFIPDSRKVNFIGFLQNVFFINYFTKCGYVDGSHWYITALVIMYVWTSIFIIFNLDKNIFFMIGFSIFSFIMFLFSSIYNIKICNYIFNILNDKYMNMIFIGIGIRFFKEEKKSFASIILIIVNYIILGFISPEYFYLVPISFFICYFAYNNKIKFLEKIKSFVGLGDMTFSIYLIHQNIGYGFLLLFSNFMNYYYSLILTVVIIYIIGVLFYFLIEKNIKLFISFLFNRGRIIK